MAFGGQGWVGALSLLVLVGMLAIGFPGLDQAVEEGSRVELAARDDPTQMLDNVHAQVTRQAAKILARAKKEQASASQEDKKGTALETKADRICKMAQHLQDTDDGEAQRARLQKEAATSLEGRAAVLVGEAAKEEETYQQIEGKGVIMRDSARSILESGTQILAKAAANNNTDARQHLMASGHKNEDHGGRLLAAAEKVLKRADLHRANSATIKELAQRTSEAAKAAMELGQRFAREAVAHRLKAMTYRSKCTMMRAKADAALRRAKDEASNARDLNSIAQPHSHASPPSTLLQTSAVALQSLLQTFAGGEDSGEEGGKHDGYGARGNGYERHSKLDEFRREQRERGVREQFEKAVEGQKAEERRITALGSIIDRDRHDYAEARAMKKAAAKRITFAKEELAQAAHLEDEEGKRGENYQAQRKVTEQLRRKVAALVSMERRKKNDKAVLVQQRRAVEATLAKVAGEAQEEHAEALRREERAQGELEDSHNLTKRASKLEGVAVELDKTAELDRRAAQAALKSGAQKLAKQAEAGKLTREAGGFRHEATRMQIRAEVEGAQSPRDMRAAQKEMNAADVLREHAGEMEGRLGGGEGQGERGRNAGGGAGVGLLARYLGMMSKDESAFKEAEYGHAEIKHKGLADLAAARVDMKQAEASVGAARASEDEDEARVRVLQGRLRATQQQEQELRARMHV